MMHNIINFHGHILHASKRQCVNCGLSDRDILEKERQNTHEFPIGCQPSLMLAIKTENHLSDLEVFRMAADMARTGKRGIPILKSSSFIHKVVLSPDEFHRHGIPKQWELFCWVYPPEFQP